MAAAYFVDTWYFVASIDVADDHHARARRIETRIAGATFLTHDAVLTEVLAYFSGFGARQRTKAAAAMRDAFKLMQVVHVDRPLFLRALDLYEARPEKEYSLVDCMSMQLMKERGITHVLTNDHHFAQEQFTVVSE